MSSIVFITGTDTGVGKTVCAALLTRAFRQSAVRVAALKPIASGGRSDARVLWRASGGRVSLDVVNPWYFRRAIAPLLAARAEHRAVGLADVVSHVRRAGRGMEWVVVEGAGGLLSPLGEGFDSRDLIVALRALPVVVSPNRLGAVNQVRLVLGGLPRRMAGAATVVLMNPPRLDAASRSNARLLGEFHPSGAVIVLPWVRNWEDPAAVGRRAVREALQPLLRVVTRKRC